MVFHKYTPDAASFDSRGITADVPAAVGAAEKLPQLAASSGADANVQELNCGGGQVDDGNELVSNPLSVSSGNFKLPSERNCHGYDALASTVDDTTSDGHGDPKAMRRDELSEFTSQSVQEIDEFDEAACDDDFPKSVEKNESDDDDLVENRPLRTREILQSLSSVDGSIGFDELSKPGKIEAGGIGPSSKCPNHPVDRGYAWVVLLACFSLQFILLGYTKSIGVFFVEFQARFSASASSMSLIIGVGEAVASLGAFLIMGFLLKYLSPRVTCLIGTLFMAVGIAANSYLTNFNYLFLTYGLGYGVGMAALYGPSLFIITQYFNKRRAFATSLATCGTSLGGIIFPLLTRRLLDTYAFQGGVLMTAGVVLHAFIFCTLLTPIEVYQERHDSKSKTTAASKRSQNTIKASVTRLLTQVKARSLLSAGSQTSDEENKTMARTGQEEFKDFSRPRLDSANEKRCCCSKESPSCSLHQPHYVQSAGERGPQNHNQNNGMVDQNGDLNTIPEVSSHMSLAQFESELASKQHLQLIDVQQYHSAATRGIPQKSESADIEPSISALRGMSSDLTKKKPLNSISDGPIFVNKYHQISIAPPATQRYRTPSETGQPNQSLLEFEKDTSLPVTIEMADFRAPLVRRQLSHSNASIFCSTSSLHTNFADIMSVDQEQLTIKGRQLGLKPSSFFQRYCISCGQSSLVRAMSFWLLTLFFFFSCIGQALPPMFIPALAKERGLSDDDAAFFLSLMNLLDFPSRLLVGVVVSCGVVKPTQACVLPMVCVGLVGQFTSLMNSYQSILLLVVVYGLFMGTYFAMQSMIVIQILGFHNFAPSIGFYYLIMGFGGAISYPIAGMLRDLTSTYSTSYHYLATAELLAVALLLLIPLTRRYDVRRGILREEDAPT